MLVLGTAFKAQAVICTADTCDIASWASPGVSARKQGRPGLRASASLRLCPFRWSLSPAMAPPLIKLKRQEPAPLWRASARYKQRDQAGDWFWPRS